MAVYAVVRSQAEATYYLKGFHADFVVQVNVDHLDPNIHESEVIIQVNDDYPRIPVPGKLIASGQFRRYGIQYLKLSWDPKDKNDWDLRKVLTEKAGFEKLR